MSASWLAFSWSRWRNVRLIVADLQRRDVGWLDYLGAGNFVGIARAVVVGVNYIAGGHLL